MKYNITSLSAATNSLASPLKEEGRLQGTLLGKHVPSSGAREAAEEPMGQTAQMERTKLSNTETKIHQRLPYSAADSPAGSEGR